MSQSHQLTATISRSVPIQRTARVRQMEGIFEVPPAQQAERVWRVQLDLPEQWNIGLIVGPSGCGKSTLARELWPDQVAASFDWPSDKSILDGFPGGMSIKEITGLLCSVGFSSPPSWLKPFHVLSNGEQFRATMARTLAEFKDLAVVDEFTSVVDRQVAKVASAAIAKAVRRRKQRFVAVSCHYDVAEWLEPDWVYQPHTGEFIAGRLLQRPPIQLEIVRVHRKAWELFKHHHYLSSSLHVGARCFVALVYGSPAAFASTIWHMSRPGVEGWREHRTVCLPDFQGVGIGNALSEFVASLFRATGKPYYSITGNPAMIWHRARSPLWFMHRKPSRSASSTEVRHLDKSRASNRFAAGFKYVGPARPEEARAFGLPVPGQPANKSS